MPIYFAEVIVMDKIKCVVSVGSQFLILRYFFFQLPAGYWLIYIYFHPGEEIRDLIIYRKQDRDLCV